MFDEEVVRMIDEYGFVTTLDFLVYGEVKLKDADTLSLGVVPHMLLINEEEKPFIVLVNYIDEESARMACSYQGTKVSFIFGGLLPHSEKLIQHIGEGIDFLRYKFDFMGIRKCEDGV
jgi:hypothetical protein